MAKLIGGGDEDGGRRRTHGTQWLAEKGMIYLAKLPIEMIPPSPIPRIPATADSREGRVPIRLGNIKDRCRLPSPMLVDNDANLCRIG